MKSFPLFIIAAVLFAQNAGSNDVKPGAPVRTIFEQHDQSGVTGKEIVIGTAMLPAGSAIGYHTHPGDESGYVLKGTLIWKVKGLPDKPLKTGDSFFNPRGSVHSIVGGPDGATALSTWIVDKDQPLATGVP
jgi:quercetin dioxygenase-like cupin family protein